MITVMSVVDWNVRKSYITVHGLSKLPMRLETWPKLLSMCGLKHRMTIIRFMVTDKL